MANTNITPSLGSLTVTGAAPTVYLSRKLPTLGSVALTGAAPVGQVDDPTLTSLGSVAFTGAAPTPRVAHSGLSITNPNATTNVPVNYQIDDRTGFKVKVKDPMVEEYTVCQIETQRESAWADASRAGG